MSLCDRCQEEVEAGELTRIKLLVPPEPPLDLDVCRRCAERSLAYIRGTTPTETGFPQRRLRPPAEVTRRGGAERGEKDDPGTPFLLALPRLVAPPTVALLRLLAYVAIAAAFFLLVTFLIAR